MSYSVVNTYIDLGTNAIEMGDHALADRLFDAAIKEIQEEAEKNGVLAPILVKIAASYVNKGRYRRAELLYKRALIIYRNVYGLYNSQAVQVLDYLGALAIKQNKLGQACQYYHRAIAALERSSSCDKELLIIMLKRLALIYMNRKKKKEADIAYRKAIFYSNT
jgi:tetratricopeptide (TPR) repeat protein